MCGIVGYIGKEQAAPILLSGLSKLEYRGYDSAGVAVTEGGGAPIEVVKAKGRLKNLSDMIDEGRTLHGTCGIGHTRWATHGEPSATNAHPHIGGEKRVVVVHNGIIENYRELKDMLEKRGYVFRSQTDTEVVAQLLDAYYTGDPLAAIKEVMLRAVGSYALGILFADRPDELYAIRKDSPLVVGTRESAGETGEQECFIASDVPAILGYTRDVYYIEPFEVALLTRSGARFFNIDGEPIEKELHHIHWDAAAAEKGGWQHFMMKEIHEQPKAVQDTVSPRITDGAVDLSDAGIPDELLQNLTRLYVAACGSAYHTGVVGRYVIESLCRVPVEVEVASEFRYRDPVLVDGSALVIVSQSGETADSLAALRLAKARGIPVIAIVNVVGSSIAREADYVLYTWAGPEIAVATTKAYSTQLTAFYLLALRIAALRGTASPERIAELTAELQTLPAKMEKILEDKERIQWFASKFSNTRDTFFIGRGIDNGVGMEGSLKLKEISYIHSESYAAGELKHGTISLIEDGTLVVGIATQPALFEKTVSNLQEVASRGAYVMGITMAGNYAMEDVGEFTVYVPKTDPLFSASLTVLPLQLLAYYVSCAKGLDVDKPRNLAKSVTVE